MNDLLGQLPALIGVAVGVLATILATTVTDKARWKRDQSVRWDTRRLDAYAEYARVIKELHHTALGLAAGHISGHLGRRVDREAGLEMLEQALAHRTILWEAVLLLGDSGTVAAAREWWGAVGKLVDFAEIGIDSDKSAALMLAVRKADGARDRFYEVARENIKVGGGSVAQAQWLPSAQTGI